MKFNPMARARIKAAHPWVRQPAKLATTTNCINTNLWSNLLSDEPKFLFASAATIYRKSQNTIVSHVPTVFRVLDIISPNYMNHGADNSL